MRLALCIGINDYPGAGNDLAGCCNDAEDWAAALIARGFETRKLLDSAASGAAIRAGLRELLTRSTAGDAVVVTYSGHGTWVPDRDGDEPDHRDEALCPHDVAQNGPLLDDELHELFALAAPGVRTVLISDSCHSGTLTRLDHPIGDAGRRARFLPPSAFLTPARTSTLPHPAAPPTTTGPSTARAAQSPTPSPALSRWAAPGQAAQVAAMGSRGAAAARSTALLLAGCRDAEYSYDATFEGRPNGAFTYVALTALAALPPTATYRDWLRAIRDRLPSEDYPQTPALQAGQAQLAWLVLS